MLCVESGDRMLEPGDHPMLKPRSCSALLACSLAAACATTSTQQPRKDVERAVASLSADELLAHMRVLASDEFEGRGPGTEGDKKTVEYLVGRFRALGLEPGNPDGSYV